MSAVGLGYTFSGPVARHCQMARHCQIAMHLYTAPQLKEAAPICGAAWYPLLWRATTSRATVAAADTCLACCARRPAQHKLLSWSQYRSCFPIRQARSSSRRTRGAKGHQASAAALASFELGCAWLRPPAASSAPSPAHGAVAQLPRGSCRGSTCAASLEKRKTRRLKPLPLQCITLAHT